MKPESVDNRNGNTLAVGHLCGVPEPQLVYIFETVREGWDYRRHLEAPWGYCKKWARKAWLPAQSLSRSHIEVMAGAR